MPITVDSIRNAVQHNSIAKFYSHYMWYYKRSIVANPLENEHERNTDFAHKLKEKFLFETPIFDDPILLLITATEDRVKEIIASEKHIMFSDSLERDLAGAIFSSGMKRYLINDQTFAKRVIGQGLEQSNQKEKLLSFFTKRNHADAWTDCVEKISNNEAHRETKQYLKNRYNINLGILSHVYTFIKESMGYNDSLLKLIRKSYRVQQQALFQASNSHVALYNNPNSNDTNTVNDDDEIKTQSMSFNH